MPKDNQNDYKKARKEKASDQSPPSRESQNINAKKKAEKNNAV